MDSDKELKIGIVTTADISGVTKTAGALDDLGGATKKLSANQYDLGADLAKVETRIEGVSGQSREMYRIFSELDRVAPGLGEGLRALVTGPLGGIGALIFGLYQAKQAWDEYDKALEKVLGEDPGAALDKANALATAFTGIADAVAKANEEFDSAAQIEDRALKNISGQLEFTRQLIAAQKQLAEQRLESQRASGQITEAEYQARKQGIEDESRKADYRAQEKADQAELTQKFNEANNAQAQAAASKRKSEAFKLPESDEAAKAGSDELKRRAADQRAQGEAERAKAARIEDANAQGNSTPFGVGAVMTGGFWDFAAKQIWEHGAAVWNYQTGTQAAKEEGAKGANDIDIANAEDAAGARRDEEIKQRDAARSKAEADAATSAKAKEAADWESNPNNAGSLAAKIQQQKTLENVGNVSAGESQLSGLFQQIARDLNTHGPGAQTAMNDAAAALKSAVTTLASLAALGDDVRDFRRQLEALQMQIQAVQSTGNR